MWGISPASTRSPVVAATRPARIRGASLTIRCRSSGAWPSRLVTRMEAAPACPVRQALRSLTLLRISAGPISRLSPPAGSIFALPLLLGSAAAEAFNRKSQYASAVLQGNAHRRLYPQAEAAGTQTLPARADARAAVSLQSRLRRLRQDRLSRSDPQPSSLGRGMPRRRR